jgi:hypothetical protein
MNRFLSAIVPLTLLLAGWWITRPAPWVSAVRSHVAKRPALLVIGADLAHDPSELGGLVWVPETGVTEEDLKGLDHVLWLRRAEAPQARLAGRQPSGCSAAHGVQLCAVSFAKEDPLWRLSDHLKGLRFSTSSGRCTAAENTVHCRYGTNGWEYARQESHRFDGRDEQCIWTHPVADQPVRIEVEGLAPGDYLLSAGIDDSGVASDNSSPIELTVAVDGGKEQALRVPNQRGLRRFRLPQLNDGGGLRIEVSVARTGARFFCWDLTRPRTRER